MSSLDTIPHQLSSYAFRTSVLPSVALSLWARHLRTNVYLRTYSYMTVTLLVLYWQNAFLPTAALVLQYVLNQANRQRLLPGLRPEDLPVLRYWGVTLLRLPMFLKSSERSLNNQPKRRTFDSSLVIGDRLTMTATALNQGGSTGWFNLAAATRVESRKPTGFILPTMDIKFTRPGFSTIRKPFWDTHRVHQACLSYGHTEPNKTALPVVHIKPKTHNESVQISIQLHWDRPHALDSIATPPTCL